MQSSERPWCHEVESSPLLPPSSPLRRLSLPRITTTTQPPTTIKTPNFEDQFDAYLYQSQVRKTEIAAHFVIFTSSTSQPQYCHLHPSCLSSRALPRALEGQAAAALPPGSPHPHLEMPPPISQPLLSPHNGSFLSSRMTNY